MDFRSKIIVGGILASAIVLSIVSNSIINLDTSASTQKNSATGYLALGSGSGTSYEPSVSDSQSVIEESNGSDSPSEQQEPSESESENNNPIDSDSSGSDTSPIDTNPDSESQSEVPAQNISNFPVTSTPNPTYTAPQTIREPSPTQSSQQQQTTAPKHIPTSGNTTPTSNPSPSRVNSSITSEGSQPVGQQESNNRDDIAIVGYTEGDTTPPAESQSLFEYIIEKIEDFLDLIFGGFTYVLTTLNVIDEEFDYEMYIPAQVIGLVRGQAFTDTIIIELLEGKPSPISVNVSALTTPPKGVTVTYPGGNTCTPDSKCTIPVTFTADNSVLPQDFTLEFNATTNPSSQNTKSGKVKFYIFDRDDAFTIHFPTPMPLYIIKSSEPSLCLSIEAEVRAIDVNQSATSIGGPVPLTYSALCPNSNKADFVTVTTERRVLTSPICTFTKAGPQKVKTLVAYNKNDTEKEAGKETLVHVIDPNNPVFPDGLPEYYKILLEYAMKKKHYDKGGVNTDKLWDDMKKFDQNSNGALSENEFDAFAKSNGTSGTQLSKMRNEMSASASAQKQKQAETAAKSPKGVPKKTINPLDWYNATKNSYTKNDLEGSMAGFFSSSLTDGFNCSGTIRDTESDLLKQMREFDGY
ncbi:MAG: hypothetical protein V4519_04640 [Patescibacteria group bacterium]